MIKTYKNINYYETILLFLVALSNFWFIRVLRANILIASFLLFTTFILYKYVNSNSSKSRLIILISISFVLLSIFSIRNAFNRSINNLTSAEELLSNQRFSLLSYELVPLFQNKVSIYYYKHFSIPIEKYQKNVFWNLDPNLYFFTNHPRERAGINEFNKFFPIEIIFFVLGIFSLLKNNSRNISLYLIPTALVSGLIDPAFYFGPILFFPFITVIIFLGIKKTILFINPYTRI